MRGEAVAKNSMKPNQAQFETLEDYSILFADIKGFSQLQPYQQRLFLREVLHRISEVVQKEDVAPEYINTWGDGLVMFFKAQTKALECALHLRDKFRKTAWSDLGLPDLKIRIALHAGEVFRGYNPVTRRVEMIGREVNRAARIEPITKPNHVYASQDFVARFSMQSRYQFRTLGAMNLAKNWGAEELFVVGWAEHDQIDFEQTPTAPFVELTPEALSRVLSLPPLFAKRLEVSWRSKASLARYCATQEFWRPEDGVFLESGTIPVYLLAEMYRRLDLSQRPRLLVTNNLGCAVLAMTPLQGGYPHDVLGRDSSYWVFPDDLAFDVILTNGKILGDYAATVPAEFFEPSERVSDAAGVFSYIESKLVSHIVMMVSRITYVDGPCAASVPMRRFKKRLLEIVLRDSDKRMTIVFEAEKLSGRRGWSACTVDGEIEDGKLWNSLLSSGRVTLICAYSEDVDEASAGLVRREMASMHRAGAHCVLLNPEGKPVPLDG